MGAACTRKIEKLNMDEGHAGGGLSGSMCIKMYACEGIILAVGLMWWESVSAGAHVTRVGSRSPAGAPAKKQWKRWTFSSSEKEFSQSAATTVHEQRPSRTVQVKPAR